VTSSATTVRVCVCERVCVKERERECKGTKNERTRVREGENV